MQVHVYLNMAVSKRFQARQHLSLDAHLQEKNCCYATQPTMVQTLTSGVFILRAHGIRRGRGFSIVAYIY